MRQLFLALFLGLAVAAQAQDLVRNGGFSQGSPKYGGMPPEWTAEPAGSGGWGYVNDDGVLGVDELPNAVVFTAGPGTGQLVQKVACQSDTDYVLRASLKANGCVPMVEVIGADGKVLASLSGDADRHGFWKHFDRKFASGKNNELTVRLTGSVTAAAGKSGIDQVSVLPATAAATALATAAVEAAKPFVAPGENVALNKPYTLSPAPSYGLCSDPGDKTQLTDGVYSEGYFWTQKSTVGWTRGMPIIVTIDLGREEPISGLAWNTAAGVSDVTWPEEMHIYVSSDQKTWFYQGDLVVLSMQERMPPPLGKYNVFRYATGALQTKGRWVQIMLKQSPYAFCDEIEVYRGQDAWLAQAAGGASTETTREHFWGQQLLNSIRKRLQSDLLAIEESLAILPKTTPGLAAAVARIPALKASLGQPLAVDAANFTTILPLNATHEAILSMNAVCLQAAGFTRPFLWRNNRWDNLSLTAIPPAAAKAAPLQVEMMRGEVRGETVNLCNPTSDALDYTIAVEGFPAGAALRLCEVLPTDTKQVEPIAAALKPTELADGSLRLRVPAGCTRQVWLSFRRPTLADGVYQGSLKATAVGQPELTVAVALRIAGQFPAAPTLHVGGWDYVNGGGKYYKAPGNLVDNMAMMRDMYVDSPWATNAVMPRGAVFDAEGRLTNADKLDFTNWDEWVELWSGARQYCVFMCVRDKFHNEAMGTERFNRMVGDYMTAWANYLKKTGMQPRQLVVLLWDEPYSHEHDRVIITWAKAIRAVNPGIVLFEDPIYRKPEEGLPEMYELCDVLCPQTPMLLTYGEPFKQFYLKQRDAGRELWLYSCSGPAKLLDPIAYHRAQKWRAFEMGAKGSFYWALGCGGGQGDSWNAYSQPGREFSPYFVSQTTVMDGKHSEAVREGVQDYEYLVMLQDRIAQLKKAGKGGAALAKAERLLAEAPGRALASVLPDNLRWEVPKDRSLMDQVRIEILHALAELK